MKPEDVMRALEHCSNDECSGVCPYDDGELNCDGCTTHLMKDAIALLREKNALNAELTQTIAKKTALYEELQLGWSEDQERTRRLLDAKDAEIERLKYILESYALQYGTVRGKEYFLSRARADAITEFAQRIVKAIHPEYPLSVCQVYRIAQEMKEGDK